MKNPIVVIGIITLSVILSYPSVAQETSGYIGIGFGQTYVDSGISNVTGSGELDEGATDGKFFLGLNLADKFSVELEYFKMSHETVDMRLNAGDTFEFDDTTYIALVNGVYVNADGRIIALSGRYNHRVGDKMTLFGRLGLADWDIDIKMRASGYGSDTDNRNGTDLMWGLGVSYDVTKNVFIGAQYEHINLSDGLNSIAYLTADVGYRF